VMAECWARQHVFAAAKASAAGPLKHVMHHGHNDYHLSCMTCANDQDSHRNAKAGVGGDAWKPENDNPRETSTIRSIWQPS